MLLLRKATTLETALGYRFRRTELLEAALTHSSFANERGLEQHYERLEFLGDAVLGLVSAEWLFQKFPSRPEGGLSKVRSHLVSARSLARYAREVRLGDALRLGVGEERSGGRNKRSLLADAMEAVFGAAYLDGGVNASRTIIVPMLERGLPQFGGGSTPPEDSKTRLQELLQADGDEPPIYRIIDEIGPDHEKYFVAECLPEPRQGRGRLGRGQGRSKKQAEQAAAADALRRLEAEGAQAGESPDSPELPETAKLPLTPPATGS